MAKLFAILALNALLLVAAVPAIADTSRPFEHPFVLADDSYVPATQAARGAPGSAPTEPLDDRDVR